VARKRVVKDIYSPLKQPVTQWFGCSFVTQSLLRRSHLEMRQMDYLGKKKEAERKCNFYCVCSCLAIVVAELDAPI